MFEGKRFDYTFLDIPGISMWSKKLNIQVKYFRPIVSTQKLYLGFNRKHKDLIQQYDEVVGQMIREGFMDKVYNKYFPYSYTKISQ